MITGLAERAARRAGANEAKAPLALGWSLCWLAGVTGAGALLAWIFRESAGQIGGAAAAIAAPALPGLTLPRKGNEALRTGLMVLWAIGAGVAVVLTGGVSGPAAVWCLVPVAAGAAFGGGRRLAEGAALAFLTAAIVGMTELSGVWLPALPADAAFWLSLLALTSTGLGLGAGLVVHQRRTARSEALAQGELGRLRFMLDDLPGLALRLTAEGKVEAAYGRAPEGVDAAPGQSLAALASISDMTAVADAVRTSVVGGSADVVFTVADTERSLAAAIARLPDNRLVALVRDVTEERDRMAVLEQGKADAEALAAGKARFLANMSHELRTPLNAIMGFSDIMRSRMFGPLPDKYAEYGSLIHESGAHLLDLINDVLDMSKIEAARYELSREIFDGREAISAALRLLRVQADGARVQLRGVLPPVPLTIDADRRALKQIVLNLVSNALKFTPKGGSVTVTAHGYEGMFELVVADNGVGISKSDLDRLGRPYEQADAGRATQGTGLGLSLVRSFAELHGGEMTIESALGEGATVSIRLPVLKAVPEPPPVSPETFGENVVAFAPQR